MSAVSPGVGLGVAVAATVGTGVEVAVAVDVPVGLADGEGELFADLEQPEMMEMQTAIASIAATAESHLRALRFCIAVFTPSLFLFLFWDMIKCHWHLIRH
jgi:hypothetical protein